MWRRRLAGITSGSSFLAHLVWQHLRDGSATFFFNGVIVACSRCCAARERHPWRVNIAGGKRLAKLFTAHLDDVRAVQQSTSAAGFMTVTPLRGRARVLQTLFAIRSLSAFRLSISNCWSW